MRTHTDKKWAIADLSVDSDGEKNFDVCVVSHNWLVADGAKCLYPTYLLPRKQEQAAKECRPPTKQFTCYPSRIRRWFVNFEDARKKLAKAIDRTDIDSSEVEVGGNRRAIRKRRAPQRHAWESSDDSSEDEIHEPTHSKGKSRKRSGMQGLNLPDLNNHIVGLNSCPVNFPEVMAEETFPLAVMESNDRRSVASESPSRQGVQGRRIKSKRSRKLGEKKQFNIAPDVISNCAGPTWASGDKAVIQNEQDVGCAISWNDEPVESSRDGAGSNSFPEDSAGNPSWEHIEFVNVEEQPVPEEAQQNARAKDPASNQISKMKLRDVVSLMYEKTVSQGKKIDIIESKIDEIRQLLLNRTETLQRPKELPDLPLRSLADAELAEEMAKNNPAVKDYIVKKLAFAGQGQSDGECAKKAMALLFTNHTGTFFNWKGHYGKIAFEGWTLQDSIYLAVRKIRPTSDCNLVANGIKEWLKSRKFVNHSN